MVRYFMSFSVSECRLPAVQKIILGYFKDLEHHGPSGMRSQCYTIAEDECRFVHIKSFRKESAAKKHFNSPNFRKYIEQLKEFTETTLVFFQLRQIGSFESIY